MSFLSTRIAAPVASSSRCFTTSAAALAGGAKGPKKQAMPRGVAKRQQKGFIRKKDKPTLSIAPKGPPKLTYAMSSTVPDLGAYTRMYPESFSTANIGKPTTLPRSTFQHLQTFGLPRRLDRELIEGGGPALVMREKSIEVVRALENAKSGSSKEGRYMLTGERGSGKSALLIQAVSYALEKGWIVLYSSRASEWIDSSAPYAYSTRTQTFHQHTLAIQHLTKLLTVNEKALSGLTLGNDLELDGGKTLKGSTTLAEACRLGVRDEGAAVQVFEAVLEALGRQSQSPVLWAIDEAHALFCQTTYRAPDFTPLEAYSLSMPLIALDHLTGRKSFSSGAILSTYSHTTPLLPLPIPLLSALSLPSPKPITPYTIINPHHFAHASSGIKRIEVPFGMSTVEAGGMYEIWSKKGWARQGGGDESFLGAFLGCSGNPSEFGKGLRYNFQALNA